jgi:hypothetical protein
MISHKKERETLKQVEFFLLNKFRINKSQFNKIMYYQKLLIISNYSSITKESNRFTFNEFWFDM